MSSKKSLSTEPSAAAVDSLWSAADLANIFRQLPERKLVIDASTKKYRIIGITDTYAKMLGVERESIIGMPYFSAFPEAAGQGVTKSYLKTAFLEVLEMKVPVTQNVFRYDMPQNNSKVKLERYWRTILYPIFEKSGEVTRILQVTSNATNEVIASRRLEEVQQMMDEALDAGRVGSWMWDMESNKIFGNAGMARIFGVDEKDMLAGVPIDYLVDHINSTDKSRVKQQFKKAFKQRSIFDTEFRIKINGKIRWVIARGKCTGDGEDQRFSGVTVDVTERRDLQAKIELAQHQDRLNRAEAKMLKERNDELQALSRSKDEFVALASHQLRTPATAVKQYLGMVLQGFAGEISQTQLPLLERAFESNERQIEIINQILYAARADTGRLAMSVAPLDLIGLVKGVVEEFRQVFDKHSKKLRLILPKKDCWVTADSVYLRMAIENLLTNADKYTPAGGRIVVSLRQKSGRAMVSVKDSGVGIADEDRHKLFEKFSRIHNPLSVQVGGTGIGLYLVSEIVRLHEGEIIVNSKLGEGSEFIIALSTTEPASSVS